MENEKIKATWTFNGNIMVKSGLGEKPQQIQNESDLNQKFLKVKIIMSQIAARGSKQD